MLRLQKQLLSLLRSGSGSASPIPTSTISPLHRHLSAAESTSNFPFSIEYYLVTTCGLTRAQTLKASRLLSHVKSPTNPNAVLAFLSGLGLSSSDIAAIVTSDTLFLCSKVDLTLAPRIAEIRNIGISDSMIARLVPFCACAIRSCDIARSLKFWIPLFGSLDELLQALSKGALGGPFLLRRDIDKVIKPNIELLLQCGLSVRDIAKTGLSGMWVIVCSPEKLKVLVTRAEELGVRRGSGQFKYALATVSAVSEEKIASRRELLMKVLGCSEDMLRIAVVKQPSLLRASEDNLRSTVEFLLSVGLEPKFIVHRPILLGWSLKARLVPRYLVMKILKDKGIQTAGYCSLACVTEKRFVSTYIDRYKDSVPELIDVYVAAREGKHP